MPLSVAALLLAAPLAGCSADAGGGGSASCATPQLRITSGEVAPGSQVTVEGRYFHACYDQGQQTDPPPNEDVLLTIRQQGTAYDLGMVDARPGGGATWTATLPEQLEPGRAVLRAGPSETLRVQARQPETADGRQIRTTTSAACEASSIRLSDREVSPGEQITVRGRAFARACNDTGQGKPLTPPARDVELELRTDGRTYTLGAASPDDRDRIVWTVEVPDDLAPGPAVLRADTSQRIEIEVVLR